MRVSNLRMGVIKKQDFGITSRMVKALLEVQEEERMERKGNCEIQREVDCMEAAVVIGFGGRLRGEEVLIYSLEGTLKFWEEKRQRRNQAHVMVIFKRDIKGVYGVKVEHAALNGRD